MFAVELNRELARQSPRVSNTNLITAISSKQTTRTRGDWCTGSLFGSMANLRDGSHSRKKHFKFSDLEEEEEEQQPKKLELELSRAGRGRSSSMGCAQSRIDNEEPVSRCKDRRLQIRSAVSARNAFSAAHSSFSISLKNAGAALSDFALGESPTYSSSTATSSTTSAPSAAVPSSSSAAAVVPDLLQPPIETLPPPPPPLPDFSPSPLQRSVSMPDLPPKKFPSKLHPDPTTIHEDDDEPSTPAQAPPAPPPMPESTWDYFFAPVDEIRPEIEEDGNRNGEKVEEEEEVMMTPETKPVRKQQQKQGRGGGGGEDGGGSSSVHHKHAASGGEVEVRKGKMVAAAAATVTKVSVSLVQVLNEVDDHFLKASESAHEVSKMLEANRMHYHSNFADNRGHIDHSARVMKIITWNRSFRGLPNGDDGKDEFDDDEWETHATVLDKLLAWEKKLYEEVKAGELMKIEYQRKVALLNKQKKRGANPEAIEKTKAAVSHLHTRYIVDMQSMDSTVSEIQRLRDEQLYPKLVELVDGMAKMWESMRMHHERQLQIVSDLRALDVSNNPKETSEHHYERTVQLWQVIQEWHSQFQKLMNHQKEYIQALNSWLKLNLIPLESNLKEKVSSPPRVHHPPIQPLLHAWHDYLEKLPDDLAKGAISSFAAVINTIMLLQQEELKQKEKCEDTQKEYVKKTRAFEDWYHKYSQRKAGPSEEVFDHESSEVASQKDPVAERKFAVEALKSRLDDEIEAHQRLCRQVREKSLGSLKTHLPELFRSMSDFARACSEMYKRLRPMPEMQGDVSN